MADPVTTSHHAIIPPAAGNGAGSSPEDVSVVLDGAEISAKPGEFLIAAAERAGVFIPRFCYHPRMKPVGMCRMCLVEVSGPRGATLQPACYLPVAAGMEVSTTSEKVRKAQDGVLELLLVNHPLDCPVCDKGGECPLQDQTLSYGPGESRFIEEKRHWAKPVPISELVLLDRERCIQCGRCVRFAAEVAGEAEIDFAGRGDRLEVAIFETQPFSSYFSGNTVQICPVGALTASTYRFGARPWDLDQVESTCTTCALGCRVAVQSSSNRVTRLLGIDSDPVNQGWLCDKGRFTCDAVNSEDRLTEPLVRREGNGGELERVTWAEALELVARRLGAARNDDGPGSIGVVGGARLSNEDAYAWAKLAKGVLGTDNVDAQIGDGLPAEVVLGLPRATIDEACSAKCVLVLAGDLREELPVLYLRLRSAVVDGGAKLVEIAAGPGSMASWSTSSIPCRPGESPELVSLLAAASGAAASGAAASAGTLPGGFGPPAGVEQAPWEAALGALSSSGDGGSGMVVVLGRPSLAESESVTVEAARAIRAAWPAARFLPALRRGNVMGALDMGLAPGILPGRVSLEHGRRIFESAWGSLPAGRGLDTAGILSAAAAGELSALVLIGADPLGDFPDRSLAETGLQGARFVVAVDTFLSPSAALADVVLPAAAHHERSGTTTNIEGRVTRVGQKLVAPGQCWPDWMIASELATRLGGDLGAGSAADLWDEIEQLAPSHSGLTRAFFDSPAFRDGEVLPIEQTAVAIGRRKAPAPIDPIALPGVESVERQGAPPRAGMAEPLGGSELAEQGALRERTPLLAWDADAGDPPHVPALDSYSLRLVTRRRLYDSGVHLDACPQLAGLIGTAVLRVHPTELDHLGLAAGDRVRVRSARGSVVLEAATDPRMQRHLAEIDANLLNADAEGASFLVDAGQVVTDIRLETL